VFAFILESQQVEKGLLKFLSEVEDFDSGVFRRKWKSTVELSDHVRRSLLWWIAKRARRSEPLRIDVSSVISQLNKAHLKILPIFIHAEAGTETTAQWVRSSLQMYSGRGAPLLPVLQETTTEDSAAIFVDVKLIQKPYDFAVTVRTIVSGNEEFDVQIKIKPDALSAKMLADIFQAFVYLLVDDPAACVETLLRWSKRSDLDIDARASLVALSVRLSMRYDLERVLEAGEILLGLAQVDEKVLALVAMAVFTTTIQFYRKGLPRAKRQTEGLYVGLLTKSLGQRGGKPEEVYTLARKALEARLDVTPKLYFELLRIHPYYEERWYWHRDLGLYYYSRGDLGIAATFYDKASQLKPDYALLHRFAADAYYYQGKWACALERFERAIRLEPTENYVLDMKIIFARSKVSAGVMETQYVRLRRRFAENLSRVGGFLAGKKASLFASALFRTTLRVYELNFNAANWLALYANRRGDYKKALRMLSVCLAGKPEDSLVRLNLVANLIFENEGKLSDVAKKHLSAAIFNGGPQIRERFALSLTNTSDSRALLDEFDHLLSIVRIEWEGAQRRRVETIKPQKFGQAFHVEV
jgi:tetratricopeptide (TPR) repeat protein